MRRRKFITLFGVASAVWPLGATAQQGEKVYKIGSLSAGSREPGPASVVGEAYRELGYVEGKNVTFEPRFAEDRLDRLPELAAELVSLKVDVITAAGTLAPLAAKRATSTIPIVMMAAGDPVGSGLVASLAHPGGNVTGTSLMSPDLGGKRLQLLKELLPELSRVAVLWNAANPYSALVFKETVGAAQTLETGLQSLEIREPADLDAALEAATDQRAGALITVEDPLTIDLRKKIAEFAANHQLPTISGLRMFAASGFLMTYGADLADILRRSVAFVDKILKGARPSDLPVEQPTKFELVINLKTAKSLGLTIPSLLLASADDVIE
jgi:putative tryptophan/tyrosine transport system substrate-binding protein